MIDAISQNHPGRSPELRPLDSLSIEYPFTRRMGDRWHGWRDGRKGIPAVLDHEFDSGSQLRIAEGNGTTPTPQSEWIVSQMHFMLICEALERVAFERRRCVLEILEPRRRFVDERMRIQGLHDVAEASRSELEELHKPDFDDPELRRSVERDAEHVTDDLARRRRVGEYRAQFERLYSVYMRRRGQYDAARAKLEAHRLEILTRCELAAYSAREIWHHYQRRRSVYNQQLMRSHQKGGRLNRILQQAEPQLPAWVEEPHRLAADLGDLFGTDDRES